MTKVKRKMMVEDLLKFSMNSDTQFSNDGNSYAFINTRMNEEKKYESHLHVHHLDEETPNQWTSHDKRDSHPRYSPKGDVIAFQSTRSGTPQIWLIPTTGGEATQMTHFTYGATSTECTNVGRFIIYQS